MNADSVKARLKNFAVSSGCTFQEALVYYGLERTIYRISVSQYASHFVLKGGIFLYAVFDRKYSRATTDVDLLARCISNIAEEMKAVISYAFFCFSLSILELSGHPRCKDMSSSFSHYFGYAISLYIPLPSNLFFQYSLTLL